MDYASGAELAAFQWNIMANPAPLTSFDSEQDSEILQKMNIVAKNISGSDYILEGEYSEKFASALWTCLQTNAGRNFVAQFAKAKEEIVGISFLYDGELSDYKLRIMDVSFSQKPNDMSVSEPEGAYRVYFEQVPCVVRVKARSIGRSKESIVEALLHEMLIHGYKVGKDLEQGSYTVSAEDDHIALRDKNMNHEGYQQYRAAQEQLERMNPIYIEIFEEADKEYQKLYNNLK